MGVVASVPNGDDVDVSASGLPEGAQLDGERGRPSWRPGQDDVGSHAIKITATDVRGASSIGALVIEVSDELPPPRQPGGRQP